MESQRTIFIIDDSQEDRMVYRRFLERNTRYNYEIEEFEEAGIALLRCQQTIPDLILLDFFLPDANGLEFIAQLKLQSGKNLLPVVMMSGQGDETVAVQAMKNGALDYLVKGRLSFEALNRSCHTVMERVRLMQQIEQQQEQQRLIGAIALRIRQSLSLQTVLNTAVEEIRNFLKADRAIVYQFQANMIGKIVAESVLPEWKSFLNVELQDAFFCHHAGKEYRQCGRCVVPNIYAAGFCDDQIQLLEQFQLQAHLIVPIVSCGLAEALSDGLNLDQPLWGLLIAHQCSSDRQWQPSEIDLLEQLSVQLALAIQQAELYQNLQNLNAQLEVKVQERSAIFNESADAIFLVDANTQLTIDCNRRAVELFEASQKKELIDIEGHVLQRYQFTPQELEKITHEINTQRYWSQEIEYVTRKGNGFWGNLAVKQINVAGREMNLVRVSDISDRKEIEKQLRRSLEEKETLLKEIHHRVKNNLQIISSLLRMQSRRRLDEATLTLFQESQNRVQSMALIHEQLYQSPDLSQINFGEYIRNLTDNLFRCYGVSRAVMLKIETHGLNLTLDTAIPCGLIINELVSNSLKYAFPKGQKGEITINLDKSPDNTVIMTVSDSGIGIPKTLDWQNSNSLGLRIVRNLTKQLKGNICLDYSHGSTFYITFVISP